MSNILVESFLCQETEGEHPEVTSEAISIIENLGLSGQKTLMTETDGEPKQRLPFRAMTEDEEVVYRCLCPTQSPIEDYSASPIPYRVLEIAKLAMQSGFFEKLEVWDRTSSGEKDPVLIGIHKKAEWTTVRYILARWGSELEAFNVLRDRAFKQLTDERMQTLLRIQGEVEGAIKETKSGFWKHSTSMPTFYAR